MDKAETKTEAKKEETKPAKKRLNNNNYIIDTHTTSCPGGRSLKVQDVSRNKKFQAILELEKKGTLADQHPEVRNYRVASVAANFDDASMYQDPETVVYETQDGYIEVEDFEDMQSLLKRLQEMDKDIRLATFGRQEDEEKIFKKSK